ncbi:MAG: DUF6531 domain-containing protein, partial [Planctomycetes bacterium]|nr:DUF6531 domain-containing protein [Planctomycetota bacterium]
SDLVPLTIVGKDTHFNSSTSIGSTTGVNLTGKIVLSPTLILCTADVDDPNAPASATITATTLDIWNLTVVYNESVNKSLPIADFLHQTNRPTVSYVPNTPSQGGNTSGPFELDLAFSANSGAQINSSTFEFIASRDVTVALANVPAGNDLSGIFSVSTSGASADIDQTAATELFADGEYTVSARVQNDAGLWSDWVSRTFYVEGADADVAKSSTLLYQGVNDQSVVITGTGFTGATDVDFGANIFVNDFTVNSNTQITADVDVEQLAVCGPRTFTVTKAVGSATGVITVEYPTNLYFSISNDEPARNAAVGGVNVFLINGEFFQGKTDIATRGRMMGISWSRFHRSEMTYNGPLGQGWVGHYYQRVKEQVGTGHILWYTPGGRIETFTNLGTGNYANPAGVYVKASKDAANGTITLMDRHRYLCTFGLNDGRLLRCTDRNGNFTECTYNAAGQLVQITDDRGFFHKVVYYPHGRVQKVQDFVWDDVTPREVVYTYDDNGDLVTQAAPETERFEDADGNRITYAYKYDSKHRITACINPREFEENESEPLAYLENFYDTAGRVYRQRYGEQDETIYLRYPTSSTVNVLDRRGLRTEYVINGNGTTNRIRRHTSLWTVDDPWNSTSGVTAIPGSKFRSTDPANYETIFSYTSQLEVQFVSYPRGNNVSYTYPNPSTLFSATSSQSITATTLQRTGTGWTPGAYAGKTLRMGNAPGPFLYYPIISNTTSTLTINSNFSLTGDGWTTSDDYAILNDNGDPLAQGNVLAVTRSIGSIPGTETDIVTRYTYEPRYQFVKTVEQPRTDTEAGDFTTTYTYDYELTTGGVDKAFGNLVRVTSPNIVLGQPSAQQIVTNTTYNEFGQVVSTTDGEGNVTLMEYYPENDPNGRAGFLKRSIAGYGVLDLFGENDYDRVGNLISSLPPRAFESGGPDLRFQVTHEVNELNQTFHTTGPQLLESGSTARADVYRFFDANFNTVQTFREYVTESGTEPPAPSGAQIHDPNFFITNKSTTPMAATYVESSVEYNL